MAIADKVENRTSAKQAKEILVQSLALTCRTLHISLSTNNSTPGTNWHKSNLFSSDAMHSPFASVTRNMVSDISTFQQTHFM